MDDGTWYVRVRGKVAGPYSLDQLKLLRKQKKLSRAHEISEDGQTWQSAGKLSELFPEVIKPTVSSPQLEIEPESEYEVEPASEYEIDMTGALELEAAAPLSQAPEVQWYYANQGQQLGPFPQANLTGLIAAGQILPETPVWREGMQEWVPAQTVPGLFAAAPGPMPAQPQFQQPNFQGQAQSQQAVQNPYAVNTGNTGLGMQRQHVPNHLTKCILVLLCCNFPFGIVALIFALKVDGKVASGDIAGAQSSAKTADMVANIGILLTILGSLAWFFLMGAVGVANL